MKSIICLKHKNTRDGCENTVIFSQVFCVYIVDDTSCCIRRIDARGGHAVCEWTTGGRPTGLSVTDGHVLVTCRDQAQLKLFTSDGELLQQVQLEAHLARPSHAVELAHSRYDGEIYEIRSDQCIVGLMHISRIHYIFIFKKNPKHDFTFL